MWWERKLRRPGEGRSRSNRRRPRSPGSGAIDALEARALLAVDVTAIAVPEGSVFDGTVATFDLANLEGPASGLEAEVSWGDGSAATPGTIESVPDSDPMTFTVTARHVYEENGAYPVTVVVRGAEESEDSGFGTAEVAVTPVEATGARILAVLGRPFDAVVASFEDENRFEEPGNFSAAVDFGDGRVAQGRIERNDRGGFDVRASYAYTSPPTDADGMELDSYPVEVSIAEVGAPPPPAVATGSARVIKPTFDLTAVPAAVGVGTPIAEQIGTLRLLEPVGPEAFRVLVTVGQEAGSAVDPAVGTVEGALEPDGPDRPGQYRVILPATFPVLGSFPYSVSVTRVDTGEVQSGAGTITVTPVPPVRISGRLSPLADTGASVDDALTSTPFPTFVGSARPFSVVLVHARRLDQKQETLLGRALADTQGNWQVSGGPLPDGPYVVSALLSQGDEVPERTFLYPPVSPLVIDSTPPAVLRAVPDPWSGVVRVSFLQDPAGLDVPSLVNPSNYALRLGFSRRALPIRPVAAGLEFANAEEAVVALRFDRRIPRHFLMEVSGVGDLAGNVLSAVVPASRVAPARPPRWQGLRRSG
ncbi:Ig-like domain-containing protein [Tautonia plasticadhaerens]|uniref:Bacterial Ig-like domain-containing protein n=1 Tax=Tautonia plasticadhaerens TaxID=2527974 RepID=A0A518HDX0_9BACT|nr:Ig-like domain-containing protein [Tautonia plasticadhaerens]QDV39047.1 hypothetical protein ElP_70090 [Tautonia plasticadhaerens]